MSIVTIAVVRAPCSCGVRALLTHTVWGGNLGDGSASTGEGNVELFPCALGREMWGCSSSSLSWGGKCGAAGVGSMWGVQLAGGTVSTGTHRHSTGTHRHSAGTHSELCVLGMGRQSTSKLLCGTGPGEGGWVYSVSVTPQHRVPAQHPPKAWERGNSCWSTESFASERLGRLRGHL